MLETFTVHKVSIVSRPFATSYMQEQQTHSESTLKLRVLAYATELFFRLGVRNVTMDGIAQELGVSKKTIYQLFKNKADIVKEVSIAFCRQNESETIEVAKSAENAIDALFKVMQHFTQTAKLRSPNLIFEIKKYYPESWQVFQKHENRFIVQKVKDNLHRGIKEGLYRPDINIEIISRMHISQMDAGLDERLFPSKRFPFPSVQVQMMELFMRGIATQKGINLINTYFEKLKSQTGNTKPPSGPEISSQDLNIVNNQKS